MSDPYFDDLLRRFSDHYPAPPRFALDGWYQGPPHLLHKAHYFKAGVSLCGMVYLVTGHHRAMNPDRPECDLWCRKCRRPFLRQYWRRVMEEAEIGRRKHDA